MVIQVVVMVIFVCLSRKQITKQKHNQKHNNSFSEPQFLTVWMIVEVNKLILVGRFEHGNVSDVFRHDWAEQETPWLQVRIPPRNTEALCFEM